MSLDQLSRDTNWNGAIPSAFDGRVIGLIVLVALLVASVNVSYGGPIVAGVAFGILMIGGFGAHLYGERRLRQITNGLVEHWTHTGGRIDEVTRASRLRTAWVIHTPEGPVTVKGLALAPMSQLVVDWRGMTDTMPVSRAERQLERFADDLYREVFEMQ